MFQKIIGALLVFGAGAGPEEDVDTGGIVMFGGSVPPSGWLLCDGAEVSRISYAALFLVVGETFGAGDSVTTFNVPDFIGRFPTQPGDTRQGGPAQQTVITTTLGGSQDGIVIDPPVQDQKAPTTPDDNGIEVEGHAVINPVIVTESPHGHLWPDGQVFLTQFTMPHLGVNFIIKT